MKKILVVIVLAAISVHSFGQVKEISRNWASFVQTADASFLKKKVKFKISASAKIITADTSASAGLWVRVDNKNGEAGFFDNMNDRPIKSNEWRTYTIEGEMDANADKINFGGLCVNNGKFYFDNFEFYVQNDAGKLQKAPIKNGSFEMPAAKNIIPEWNEGTNPLAPVRVKEFTIASANEGTQGKLSLLLEGKGIVRDTTYLIGPVNGFSPQIGTLVTMLNNLSSRVESAVRLLNQQETDHLMDDKANSIGALVMHLAAAEAYYQVYTFENREFNEEEKKKWDVALNLGDEARQQFKGHDIEYYLAIYKEVRQKTIEELRKRNDQWLAQERPGSDINNHFCWFHVMEHQSSHLGQILLMKKRLPKRTEKQEIKVERNH
ncbi:mycothiol transferase [Ohtaekwangia koreensis]|uniref:DinB superfamily protein n=1 Tax=Ohtaekwangia koreensis TaxID=688867 RepID=A0A1T5LPA4_9BACT|nr:DUF664 domain-containing protein [Ohtaekwangia koreensis]SKC77780.1 Protein of unknown function [Ohtaekwangia koreensis]